MSEVAVVVSMKSGLEGRNNVPSATSTNARMGCLNEVRPRRPEQLHQGRQEGRGSLVSMKSGLEGRNKWCSGCRPGRPNVVSMKSDLEGRNK